MTMALKREASIGVGLATAALVYMIYSGSLPSVAEARVSAPDDRDLSAAERAASFKAAAVVAGISLISADPTVFIIGGSMIIFEAWTHRHANAYDPTLGSAMTPSSRQVMDPTTGTVDTGYSLPG